MKWAEKMKSARNRRLLVVGGLVAVLAVAFGAWQSTRGASADPKVAEQKEGGKEEHDEKKEELTLTTDEAQKAGIKVEEAKAASAGETIVLTATIQPSQERIARISPRVEGRITSTPAKLGDAVRAGQTLATLDSVAVGEAHAAWVQAQAELRIANSDFKRAESLVADEIIPRKDFLRAQAERDKATANLRNTADRLRLLGGTPDSRNASGFSVTAPFAGTVTEKKATIGSLANPSEPIYTIADLSRVWIQADLPESALAKVRVGARARVTVSAYPQETFEGSVGYIGAGVNKESRTASARIEVPNAGGRLKPEMFATANIEVVGDRRNVLSLPDESVVLMQGQPTVFVFEQGAYAPRVVDPGERIAGRTVIRSGIRPGEQVVTAGAYALKARQLKSQIGHGH